MATLQLPTTIADINSAVTSPLVYFPSGWSGKLKKRFQKQYRELTNQYGQPTPLSIALGIAVLFLFTFIIIASHNFGAHGIEHNETYKLDRKISIIVPTYKEVENIPVLAQRVFQVCAQSNLDAEMIIVDDNSEDGTVEQVQKLSELFNIRVHVRKTEKGLSSAVLKGMEIAKHPIFVVMDADLSHPPETIPNLVEPIIEGTSDFAIGSRYTDGGNVKDWPLSRRIISFGATVLARPLVRVSDPMSGFFAIRRKVFLRGENINDAGFKIALELMVKCGVTKVAEIPIVFTDRVKGVSKLKLRTQLQYLFQVFSLYVYVYPALTFGLVAVTAGGTVAVLRYIAIKRRWIHHHSAGRGGLIGSVNNSRPRSFF